MKVCPKKQTEKYPDSDTCSVKIEKCVSLTEERMRKGDNRSNLRGAKLLGKTSEQIRIQVKIQEAL